LTLAVNKSFATVKTKLVKKCDCPLRWRDGLTECGKYTTQSELFTRQNLYSVLAKDLMESSRPNGLSRLELDQYELLFKEQAIPV